MGHSSEAAFQQEVYVLLSVVWGLIGGLEGDALVTGFGVNGIRSAVHVERDDPGRSVAFGLLGQLLHFDRNPGLSPKQSLPWPCVADLCEPSTIKYRLGCATPGS